MILLILFFAAIVRLISINQSLWLDEAINVLAAKNFSFWGIITQYAKADFHPPGYFIIIWVWTRIFGYSEIAVRAPSVIFGVLTVYLGYLIGRKLHSKTAGLILATVMSVNPLHIYYSQEARMYSFAAFAVALNILLFIRFIKGEKINLLLLIASNLLILLSDYVAYLILPSQLIFILIGKQKKHLKEWFTAISVSAAGMCLYLPVFINQLSVGISAAIDIPNWRNVVGNFNIQAVPLTYVKFIIGRISFIDKTIYALVFAPIGILFLFLIIRGIKSLNNFNRNLVLSLILTPIILALLISILIPIYSYFRLLFTLLPFLLLVAFGIMSFQGKFRYILFTLVFLIEIISSGIYLFNPIYQREDWRGLVNYFKEIPNAKILFESSGSFSPFDYYSDTKIKGIGGLKNFPAKQEGDIIDLNSTLKDNTDVYLVDYLVEIADPDRLISKDLSKLGYAQTDIKNFNGVGFVYHYFRRKR